MKREEKEKLSLYGKLFCDFANGDTTDRVLTDYFLNLQSALGFSKDFQEKALSRYPTKKIIINSLSKEEQSLFELLLERNEIINNCISDSSIDSWSYDPAKQMITVVMDDRYLYPFVDDKGDNTHCKLKMIPLADINKYLSESGDTNVNEHFNKTLAAICHHIGTNKHSTNRLEKLQQMAQAYRRTSDQISDTQKRFKDILLQLIESDNPYETAGFHHLLIGYNTIPRKTFFFSNDQKLAEIGPFTENYFLYKGPVYREVETFDTPIPYFIIEFLKNPDYSGIERIAICQHCKHIFCKTKLYEGQLYCPSCSRRNKKPAEEKAAYMKEYRKNPRVKKAVAGKKREEKIQLLIDNAGKTRQQAEIIVDGEV